MALDISVYLSEMCLRLSQSLMEIQCLRLSQSLMENQATSLSLLCAASPPCLFYSMPCYSSTVGLSVLLACCALSHRWAEAAAGCPRCAPGLQWGSLASLPSLTTWDRNNTYLRGLCSMA